MQKSIRHLFFVFCLLVVSACAHAPKKTGVPAVNTKDSYLWLEDVEGPRALDWVRAQNKISQKELEARPNYSEIEADLRKILLAKDRIPEGDYFEGYLYNFWQDDKNIRGLWRRTTLAEYKKKNPQWETLLDLDELAKAENENWVWKGYSCRSFGKHRCLLNLSRGGKDAVEVREFSLEQKRFVENGFRLPEAKTRTAWLTADKILVATDFGPGTLTKAGYARQVRVLERGQTLERAQKIFESPEEDTGIWLMFWQTPQGDFAFIVRGKTFFENEYHLVSPSGETKRLPVPDSFDLKTVYQGYALGVNRQEWQAPQKTFATGSLVALNLRDFAAQPELLRRPVPRTSIVDLYSTRTFLYVGTLDNVKSKVWRYQKNQGRWAAKRAPFPEGGEILLTSADTFEDVLFAKTQDFLNPPAIWVEELRGTQLVRQKLKELPKRFQQKDLVARQYEATSRDGTKIPYFIVHKKNMALNGKNPTLLNGYGGFEISETPYYLNGTGKVWAEKGGVYVLANIRGGGEFGPDWHKAALKENRQRAFDDFIGIAEDLIRRKITSPQHLGILGGSNGGLLVGATFTQRPDLLKAVICQVPLLDMLRYHQLLAGFSWIGEYGNPDVPEERRAIEAYSPYQKVEAGKKYPRVLFLTSTKDDRVHPGHARKMTAKMLEQGHDVLLYENIEGGHGGAANLEQKVKFWALSWTFLWKELR